jgi:uncharacterized membrane protein
VPGIAHNVVALAVALCVSATQSFRVATFAAQYVMASTGSRTVRLGCLLLWFASAFEAMGQLLPLLATAASVAWMCAA